MNSKKIRISAALIVLNEEAYLERCLKNLSDQVDEIVVVDGGSTDQTVEIAGRYARLFEKKFDFNFREQRNFSFEQCRGDWILMVDADEYFNPDFYQGLRSLVNQNEYDAFSVVRYNRYLNQIKNPICRWYQLKKNGYEQQTRLFRSYCWCNGGLIHEYVDGFNHLGEAKGLLIHDKSLRRQKYSNRIYNFLRKNQKPQLSRKRYNSHTRELD